MADLGPEPPPTNQPLPHDTEAPPTSRSKEFSVTTATPAEVESKVQARTPLITAQQEATPTQTTLKEATPTCSTHEATPVRVLLEATPTTLAAATTEEEAVSQDKMEGEPGSGGEPGPDQDQNQNQDQNQEEVVGGSGDQQRSTDPPSSVGGDDIRSSLPLSEEGVAPPTKGPGPQDDAQQEAAGGAAVPSYYLVKWITWKEKKTPIITQSENGPCPLLAVINTMFLRWKAQLPSQTEVVTSEELMAHLGECVLSVTPREKTGGMELNFQQNMSDAMLVLPKLSTGLDVNVRFTGVRDFEYTPECIVFDLLDIPLYHGWLLDPQSPETVAAVGTLSYNQLVEKIIDYKHSADSSRVSEALAAEQFLESTATQLSYHGLCELNSSATEGEISVFFRNNHFSTMIKHKGHLYLLVTDQGFLQEDALVWESLHNVEGDGNFCDSDFRLLHPPHRAPPTARPPPHQQVEQDYLVAVNLQQQQGDLELARQLQEEEYQQQQQQHQQQQQQQVRGQPGSQQARRRDRDSDCVVL